MLTEIRHVAPESRPRRARRAYRNPSQLRQNGDTLRDIAAALDCQALRTRLARAWWLEQVTRIIKQDAGAG